MVYKDLEGTKQARKELAEKESKVLLALQGGKPPKPKSKLVIDMIATSYEDYKQFKSLFTPDTEMDSDEEIVSSTLIPPKLGIENLSTINDVNELKVMLEAQQFSAQGEGSHQPMNDPFGSYLSMLNASPTYFVYKKKMEKLERRSLLKELIKKYATESFDLSLVDTTLSDEQVDDMLTTCIKLELDLAPESSVQEGVAHYCDNDDY